MSLTRLHACCAARDEAGVLISGVPGAGKSDLLLRLIGRGYRLVADDRVELEDGLARAPAALRGLIEIRGWGVIRRPFIEAVRPVLMVRLVRAGADVPRLPDCREAHDPETDLPVLWLDGMLASAPDRIDAALDCLAGRAFRLPQGAMLTGDD